MAVGNGITVPAGQDRCQGALAAAIRPHEGVRLAGLDGEVDALENFAALDAGTKSLDVEDRSHGFLCFQPTLPSRLTPRSFCASTANSIGNSRKTSLQKPFTIMFVASWVERPRWLQ